jgi:preprotein translocase subunit SecA
VFTLGKKLFGTNNERQLKRMWPMVSHINEIERKVETLSDIALQGKTNEFRERLDRGESLDELLPEAFAVVREASRRVLGMRHFDVQMLGGIVLHQGTIAEMKTGEGKTLTATSPVYLNALTGKGVHLVTVNDYLAKRDAEWMGAVYSFLGLTTGVALSGLNPIERKAAYDSDITYGQNNEFGFDYLRDNMKLDLEEKAQREHYYAIVDEVDSILIDESRTPLIISGPSEKPTENYQMADQVVRRLREDIDWEMDLKSKQPSLTDEGMRAVEKLTNTENLYDPGQIELVHHINQALKAHTSMKRDIDYVVRNGEVIIVDEFTGRLMAGRRWSDGLHQAVEAKEGVPINRENQTLATITFQNYFRMYDKLAGMTGTADTEAVEFKKIYNLDVIVIPTNEPMKRIDHPDVVYSTERGKNNAVVREIAQSQERGQPVLVGTASIASSEMVSAQLKAVGVPHHVLNAKQHEREAEIVAQAGRIGAVTISTNMAGRGTDILLGGNPEFLAADAVGKHDPEDTEFQQQLEHFKAVCAEEKKKVLELGGLHILGTERHESRRIDNQLRGRSGRQGDPGSSRFFVSLEDDLMKRFGGERIQSIMTRVGLQEDDAIEGSLVARAIENAQKKVEGHHFDIRKHLLEYDDVMNKQREVIYNLREKILRNESDEDTIRTMIGDVCEDIVMVHAGEKVPVRDWDVTGMFTDLYRQFGLELDPAPFVERQDDATSEMAQEIFEFFQESALARYEERRQRFGVERMEKLERIIHLQAIDFFWKEHLNNMDHLKEGIGLRSFAQKNPLHEYQREAFFLFEAMNSSIHGSILQNLFLMELPSEEEIEEIEAKEREAQRRREEAASEIHENMDQPAGKEVEAQNDGLNRKQRRKKQAPKKYELSPEDYAPNNPDDGGGVKSKRDSQKKKRKSKKQARRKNR